MTIYVSDILVSLRRRIRQPDQDNSNWTNLELLPYLNDFLNAESERIGINARVAAYTGTGGPGYPLPPRCRRVTHVKLNGYEMPRVLVPEMVSVDPDTLWSYGSYGWLIYGDSIYFLPSLSPQNVASVYYEENPAEILSAEATIEVPELYRMPIVHYMARECFAEIKDGDRAGREDELYQRTMRRARQTETERQFSDIDSPRIPPVMP